MALVVPSSAVAYQWTRSPVDPLIQGGVHSKSKFRRYLASSTKVRSAIRAVIKADRYPGWVLDAAARKAAAGHIHTTSLKRGSRIGAMAFGTNRTKTVKNTVWAGKGRLPYYYVYAGKTVVQNGYSVTTTFKVCLAKSCANPFVIGRRVSRVASRHNLFVDTRDNDNLRVGGFLINGVVGTQTVSVQTTDTAATLIGQFPVGTPYSLGVGQPGAPSSLVTTPGYLTGTMPASDLTLTFTVANI